jgi:hypothetical protein
VVSEELTLPAVADNRPLLRVALEVSEEPEQVAEMRAEVSGSE